MQSCTEQKLYKSAERIDGSTLNCSIYDHETHHGHMQLVQHGQSSCTSLMQCISTNATATWDSIGPCNAADRCPLSINAVICFSFAHHMHHQHYSHVTSHVSFSLLELDIQPSFKTDRKWGQAPIVKYDIMGEWLGFLVLVLRGVAMSIYTIGHRSSMGDKRGRVFSFQQGEYIYNSFNWQSATVNVNGE